MGVRPRGGGALADHAHGLRCVAENLQIRLREIAAAVGITERPASGILDQMVEAGYVARTRVGRRNEHLVRPELPLRHPWSATIRSGSCCGPSDSAADQRASFAAAALEAARDGIVVRDADGRILDVNRRFCGMTGLALEDLVGLLPPFPIGRPASRRGSTWSRSFSATERTSGA